MILDKSRLAFMVTTEAEALEGLARTRPGLLIVTEQLEEGSGLAVVEQARGEVADIRTILIVDGPDETLAAAGRSTADAVLREADCFEAEQPLMTMIRSLAVGRRFRSAGVAAAMQAAADSEVVWRDARLDLSARELEHIAMLVEGLGDREIAARQEVKYETARSRGKTLRRKLGVRSRAQVVARALHLGLDRLNSR